MKHDHAHSVAADLALRYASGQMDDAERQRFENHLAGGCEICLRYTRSYLDLGAEILQVMPPAEAPSHLLDTVLAHIAEQDVHSSPLAAHWQNEPQVTAESTPLTRRARDAIWQVTPVAGVSISILYIDRERDHFAALVRMAPGSSYPPHSHSGLEHCLVLEGDLHVGQEVLRAGDYHVAPEGSKHGVQSSEHGCLLFITSSLHDEFE